MELPLQFHDTYDIIISIEKYDSGAGTGAPKGLTDNGTLRQRLGHHPGRRICQNLLSKSAAVSADRIPHPDHLSRYVRYFQRTEIHPLRQSACRNSGTRPLSRSEPGAWTELFRAERRSAAAVSGEHFQGDQGRCGHRQHRQARRADQLGKARGTAAEHGADRPCRTGEFPQRQRLGTVHR